MQKKKAAPGAEPTTAEPIPLYMPEKPPEGKKPAEDWRRVFRVSRGKRERSTVVPARAPARRADWKDGEDMLSFLCCWGLAVGGGDDDGARKGGRGGSQRPKPCGFGWYRG